MKRKFQFRASFTNVFNHPQRFLVDEQQPEAAVHQRQPCPTRTSASCRENNKYGRRIIQLAFKYYF